MAKDVVDQATMVCPFGIAPSVLLIKDGHNNTIKDKNAANISDHIPIKNIVSFVLCKSMANPAVAAALGVPQPCVPVTPLKWSPGHKKIILKGEKILTDQCICPCIWGGIIAIADAGQALSTVGDTIPKGEKEKHKQQVKKEVEDYKASDEGKKTVAEAKIKAEENAAKKSRDKQASASPASKTCTGGEPVSIVTGEEILQQTDFVIPGIIPITWERTYRSGNADNDSRIGYGWTSPYSDHLKAAAKQTLYIDSEGRSIPFPKLQPGKKHYHELEDITLYCENEEIYRLQLPDGKVYTFSGESSEKKLAKINDKYKNSLNLYYNKKGLLEKIQSIDKAILFEHTKQEKVSKIYVNNNYQTTNHQPTTNNHQLTSCEYNDKGDLIKVTDACGHSDMFEYNKQHLITKRTLKTGFSFYFEWKKTGDSFRCIRSYGDDGIYDTKFDYNIEERITKVTDGCGNTQTYFYNDRKNIIKHLDGKGNGSFFWYNEKDSLALVTDQEESCTQYFYDKKGRLTKRIDPKQGEHLINYNESGLPVESVGPTGNTSQKEYNELGELSAVIDPEGGKTLYDYNKMGLPIKITNPLKNTHKMEWNKYGQLVKETDTTDNETAYEYNDMGYVSSIFTYTSNQKSEIQNLKYTYDPMGRIASVTDAHKRTTKLTYNEYGEPLTVIDPFGDTTYYKYNGLSKLTEITKSNGEKTKYFYDKEQKIIKIINRKGSEETVILKDYDEAENLKSIKICKDDKCVKEESYTYDKANRLIAINDTKKVITNEYDGLGRKTKQHFKLRDNREISTAYTYYPDGLIKSETVPDAADGVISYKYDKLGRPVKITMPDDTFYEKEYSHAGPTMQVDRAGRKTLYTYNKLGKITSVKNPEDGITEYSYDRSGNLTKLKDANGNITQWKYNKDGHLIEKIYDDSNTLTYDYNNDGQLIKQKDAANNETIYEYDKRGRLTNIQYPDDEKNLKFTYDSEGHITSMNDDLGTTLFSYDSIGKLSKIKDPLKGDIISYGYNDFGRKIQLSISNLKSKICNLKSEITYDSFGRIYEIAAPDNSFGYHYYNIDHKPGVFYKNKKQIAALTTDTLSRPEKRVNCTTDGNILSILSYKFNDADLITEVLSELGTEDSEPELNNPEACSLKPEARKYEYDSMNRVIHAKTGKILDERHASWDRKNEFFFEYDKMGNHLALDKESRRQPLIHNKLNRLNQYTRTNNPERMINNPEYSRNGNLLYSNNVEYKYNTRNQLIKIRNPQSEIRNIYDGFGRRRIKEVYKVDTKSKKPILDKRIEFLYDGWNIIRETVYNHKSEIINHKSYTWGVDLSGTLVGAGGVGGLLQVKITDFVINEPEKPKPIMKEVLCSGVKVWRRFPPPPPGPKFITTKTAVYFPQYNVNGDIISYTDENDKIVAEFQYSPFGDRIYNFKNEWDKYKLNYEDKGPLDDELSFKFSTKYHDTETNLYDYGLRFYSPKLARWLQREPLGEAESTNLYAFVANNPISQVDVNGEWLTSLIGGIGMSISALVHSPATSPIKDVNVADITTTITQKAYVTIQDQVWQYQNFDGKLQWRLVDLHFSKDLRQKIIKQSIEAVTKERYPGDEFVQGMLSVISGKATPQNSLGIGNAPTMDQLLKGSKFENEFSYVNPGEQVHAAGFKTLMNKIYSGKYPNKQPKLPQDNIGCPPKGEKGKVYKEGDKITLHREYDNIDDVTTDVKYEREDRKNPTLNLA